MDGVDAAIVDVQSMQLIEALTFPYPSELKNFLIEILSSVRPSYSELIQLHRRLGLCFADAVESLLSQSRLKREQIEAIGSHGQTLWHQPDIDFPFSLQLACPHSLSERTGMTVVADFRTRDIVAGGQGAPFAPLFHEALWGQRDAFTAIVNIGGIANISLIGKGKKTRGWDIGPGNCLMDQWIHKHQSLEYDENGQWAATGNVVEPLVQSLMKDPLLKKMPPNSFDRNDFSLVWLDAYLEQYNARPEDIQASLNELTARCIQQAIQSLEDKPETLYLCGGGARNTELKRRIQNHLPEISLTDTSALGVDADYVEAMLFAWLASKTLHREKVDLRAISGSKKPVLLGAVYYP